MITSKAQLRNASLSELLAGAVLIFEALYFVIAAVVVTGFGVVYAQGGADAHGALGIVSLPLLVVGAFAVWSLALLHVLPSERGVPRTGSAQELRADTSVVSRRIAMTGFYVVVIAHLSYALILISQTRFLLASAILVLTALLLVCSITQMHLSNRRRKDVMGPGVTV